MIQTGGGGGGATQNQQAYFRQQKQYSSNGSNKNAKIKILRQKTLPQLFGWCFLGGGGVWGVVCFFLVVGGFGVGVFFLWGFFFFGGCGLGVCVVVAIFGAN